MAEAELLGLKPFIVKESSSGILLKPEAKTILDKHGLKYEYNPELGDKLIFLPLKQLPHETKALHLTATERLYRDPSEKRINNYSLIQKNKNASFFHGAADRINTNCINTLCINFDDKEIQQILIELKRESLRETTSLRIDKRVLEQVFELFEEQGISHKKLGRLVELLLLKFIEKVKKQLGDLQPSVGGQSKK